MPVSVCCIGHITLDKIITPSATTYLPGGTAIYFSYAFASLQSTYLLVTALADKEMPFVTAMQAKGIHVQRLPSAHTVFFENRYGANPNERTQRVLQQADAFAAEALLPLEASIYHLGPLLAGDIPKEAISALAGKGKISLDVQGLLRSVDNENVVATDWHDKEDVLPFVHYLKASEEEMQVLTGCADVFDGARTLAGWGVKEVILTLGNKGSVIYIDETFFLIPAYEPTAIVDATGCGDTYMAGYLHQRESGAGPQEAGEFAAAMATLNLAVSGPFSSSREDVNQVLAKGSHTNESIAQLQALRLQPVRQ